MPPTFTRYRVTGSGDIRYNYEDELQICSITRLVTILSDKSQFVSYFPTKPPPQIRGPQAIYGDPVCKLKPRKV